MLFRSFKLGISSNWYSVGAFLLGTALLAAVLFVPGLSWLFQVSEALTLGNVGQIVLLAFCPAVLIQIWKIVTKQ